MKPQQPLKQPPAELFWKAVFKHLGPELAKLPKPEKKGETA